MLKVRDTNINAFVFIPYQLDEILTENMWHNADLYTRFVFLLFCWVLMRLKEACLQNLFDPFIQFCTGKAELQSTLFLICLPLISRVGKCLRPENWRHNRIGFLILLWETHWRHHLIISVPIHCDLLFVRTRRFAITSREPIQSCND